MLCLFGEMLLRLVGGGDVMHDTWLQKLMQPINPTSVSSCTRSLLDLLSPVPAFAAWCVDHPVGAQQDAAEFTSVLLAPMSGLYSGIAESRQTQNQTRVIDIGHMICLTCRVIGHSGCCRTS